MNPDQLNRAREAANRGDKAQARAILRKLILKDARDEDAWYLLAQVVEGRQQSVDCLERVLLLNPHNQSARRALSVLSPQRAPSQELTLLTQEAPIAGGPESPQVRDLPDERPLSLIPQDTVAHPEELDLSSYQRRPPPNWPLLIGGMLVMAIFLIAIFGPQLAPRDPLETTPLLKVGKKYLMTPYPIFSPGFPLGSDDEGRDLLSRLLWGIRPTMIMVLIVAAVRLVLGTLIGLIAGWSTRWPGRMLDSAIAAAISIPVIIVALGGIAAVGVDLGIWAFIIALSLTGWVETARMVREQTQVVREQEYIEAAHALGGSSAEILSRHVLRQVSSLLWMLFAFEISSTLMLVAALGFLGYYIGGDIWIAVSDATAAAISGMPEVGQLLATMPVSVTRPWPLLVIGAVVFVIVLGFNLLGEGLRRQASLHGTRRRSTLGNWFARASSWADQNLWWPLSNVTSRKEVRLAALILPLLLISIGLILWQALGAYRGEDQQLTSAFPQSQQWASARHDPYGTHWSQAVGPRTPQVNWTFTDESGFPGGPVVAGDGTLYIASNGGVLYALEPDGEVIWQTLLPAAPVGTPGINQSGEIFVTDEDGGLAALDPQGEIEWYFQPEKDRSATTGPVIAPDGSVYYVQWSGIQAVSSDGNSLWQVNPGGDISPTELLQLSPDSSFVFWGGAVLDAQDGSPITWDELPQTGRYFVGADGETYLVDGHEIVRWETSPAGAQAENTITWDYEKYSLARTSKDAGVTPDGLAWLFYTGFARRWGLGEDTRLVWLDQQSNLRGKAFYPIRNSQVIAVDQNATLYTCGNLDYGYGLPECQAFSPESEEPIWKLLLEDSSLVAGGALVPGRLYVATQEGVLYAIGAAEPLTPAGEVVAGDQEKPTRESKDDILAKAREPIGPATPVSSVFFTDESGFSGGLVAGQGGNLHIASNDGNLYALDPAGEIVWQANLPAGGVGNPVIGGQGEIYVIDKEAGLSAYSPDGELIWHYQSEPGLSGIAGPVVSMDGGIYYTVGTQGRGSIQAVSREGEPLWLIPVRTDLFYRSPDVSPIGDLVFFRDEVYDAEDGSPVDLDLPFEVDRFFAGQDGRNYLQAGGTVAAWEFDGSTAIVSKERVLSRSTPQFVGVTSEGVVWMLYADEAYWFTRDGQALGVGNTAGGWVDFPAGVDRDFTIYACGRDVPRYTVARLTCFALSPQSHEPIWQHILSDTLEELTGSVLVPGRIYLSTEGGNIYLIEESQ